MSLCKKRTQCHLSFDREYAPAEFLAGRTDSLIWIVGLNPKDEGPGSVPRTRQELVDYFNVKDKIHPFFKRWETICPAVFNMLGKHRGAAAADLVVCASEQWPPKGLTGPAVEEIIGNCQDHLVAQIKSLRPRLLICNGRPLSQVILRVFEPPNQDDPNLTAYTTTAGGWEMGVVLSGFVGRLDNYAKRRLGREIQEKMDALGIG